MATGGAANAADERAPLVAADVGSVYTKVYVLERVEGERRLVAVGWVPTIGDDGRPAVAEALRQAVEQALAHAGRPALAASAERVLLASTGRIPRVAAVVPRAEDAEQVRAALEGAPMHLLEPLALDGAARDPEALLAQVEAQAPDVVVVFGGQPAGPQAGLAAVETLAHGFGAHAPPTVLVGDEAFTGPAAARLAASPHLVAGGAAGEGVLAGVRDLAARHPRRGIPGRGGAAAAEWPGWEAAGRAASSLESVCAATAIVAERYDVDVLTLDLGASHALAAAAGGARAAGGRRRVVAAARDDVGSRQGRRAVLAEAGAGAIARWLPVDRDHLALRADARQGLIAPAALPETVEQLLVEHAFAREALRLVAADLARALGRADRPLPPVDLLIGSGGVLAGVPRLMQAVLMLLDAVAPEALTQLALDRATALPLLGYLGARDGGEALGAGLERDGLLNLGLCVAPIGTGREGDTAIRVEVVYADRSPVTVEVPFGAIEVVPLAAGERASLKLWPEREFDIGLGRGAAATPRADIEGGAVGIVIDARGRPLALPEAPAKRQAKLLQWLQATRAYPQLSFVHPPAAAAPPEGEG